MMKGKVSKTVSLELSDMIIIEDASERNSVSDSEAVRQLLRLGNEAMTAKGHDSKACKLCQGAAA